MPLTGKEEQVQDNGEPKTVYQVTFSNGAFQQLQELQSFMKLPDPLEVIRIGIGFIQNFKEDSEKKQQPPSSNPD